VVSNPLIPLGVFRIPGIGAADVSDLIAIAGFVTMFFFLTLYMQTVLGFSPLQTGAAYLPLTVVVGVSAGIGTQLITRVGTRPVLIAGLIVTGGGLIYLSRIPVNGSYVVDILPPLLVVAFGVGGAFAAITTAGNAGVPADRAGLAAALLNAAQQVGGALGLAVLSAIATSRTDHLLGRHEPPLSAATAGFQRALFIGGLFVLAATLIALRTRNSRGEQVAPEAEAVPVLEPA
jgi:MFS family permease